MPDAGDLTIEEALEESLDHVTHPGTFCASGSARIVLPGLNVKGVGPIGLPLARPQVEALKARAEQAPYGKGTETLVDTGVRRVWRLTPDKFKLTSPAWKEFIDEAVAKVQADLGLERQKLEAHLYDLLLYEAGGFFLPHRDGEKLDRMVATLVVVLPSYFKGGELIVRHEGRERVVDFSGPESFFKLQYAAFYADCEHEVKPLKSGYRLCLVYNLTLAKSKSAKAKGPPAAPRIGQQLADVVRVLRDWKKRGTPGKLAVLLEHQYSQDGLSWDALKGADRAKARVLEEAARQTGFQVHLAQLTYWESGGAEEEYGYGGYDDYGWGYDEEEDAEEDDGNEKDDDAGDGGDRGSPYKMVDLLDQSVTADHWRSPDGRTAPFGKMPVSEEEVIPPDKLKSVTPREEFEGYTGNEGMTLQRWYRHAGVILWPDNRHLDVLLQAGSRQASAALERMVSDWAEAKGAEADALEARCLKLARKVLDDWPERSARQADWDWHEWGSSGADKQAVVDPIAALLRLDDAKLIGTYIGQTMARDASLDDGLSVAKAVVRHGWATFRPPLLKLLKATTAETVERNARLLERLCQVAVGGAAEPGTPHDSLRDAPPAAERRVARQASAARETCRQLADAFVAALGSADVGDEPLYDEDHPEEWKYNPIDRPKMLVSLTRALVTAELDGPLWKAVDYVRKMSDYYPLRQVQLPALAELAPWLKKQFGKTRRRSAAVSNWVTACLDDLELLTVAEPQPPTDLRRDADISCKCADCKALKKFLLDPNLKQQGFQMPQDRRRHLERQIEKHKIDVSCKTDRRPRPQILVCTKTVASYNRKLKQYHEDLKHLAAVRAMEKSLRA